MQAVVEDIGCESTRLNRKEAGRWLVMVVTEERGIAEFATLFLHGSRKICGSFESDGVHGSRRLNPQWHIAEGNTDGN